MPGSITNVMPGGERLAADADVVHVVADPVGHAVRRPDLELSCRSPRSTRPSLTSPARSTSSHAFWMSCVRGADLRGLDARLLRGVDDLVQLALRRREPPADRIGAGDVNGQTLVVRGRVDEQHVAVLHLARRLAVVEDGRVRAAADDRRIAPAHGAAAQVDLLDRRLHFVLELAAARPRACRPCAPRSKSARSSASRPARTAVLICRSSFRIGVASLTWNPKNRSRIRAANCRTGPGGSVSVALRLEQQRQRSRSDAPGSESAAGDEALELVRRSARSRCRSAPRLPPA